jgi:ATP-dependent Clp protease adaptor protein ClpS
MSDTGTLTQSHIRTSHEVPWNVIVHDDPVNLMGYVTWVLMKVFGYEERKSTRLMMEVHQRGKSVVWIGHREQAEHYTHQLQAHQLKATLEKAP